MFFGRDSFKFVFIGAGSATFTMRLTGDILSEDFIHGGTLSLVDVDASILGTVEKGVRALVKHSGKAFAVETHTDYRAALSGADFVFLTFAIGGYSTWKQDILTSTRYGVNQSVGDTIGPGAIARILRTIPVTMEIAREMERVCPEAYIINYANPEGAQCLAIQRYTKIRSFGLCHGTPDTARELAEKVFKVPAERFDYEAAGVNHLTWFTAMRIDGKDVYPKLDEALRESGFSAAEPISHDLFRVFGLYPAPGDRHVSEFFSAFLRDRVMSDRNLKWKNNDFKVVDSWRDDGEKRMERLLNYGENLDHFLEGSGETSTHFIRALATGRVVTEMVNVLNRGYIENIADNVIVELPTFVNAFGLKPQSVGRLPAGIAAKCEMLGREYELLVDAAIEIDLRKVLQAAYIDPLCANCDYPEDLVRDLIRENLRMLPKAWAVLIN